MREGKERSMEMKILVACEFSGVVRDAFINKGHNAWSCDLLPTQKPGPHICGNVLEILDEGWDMMIAHPPCTHLAVSGAPSMARKPQRLRNEALQFVSRLLTAPIEKIALENPVSIISTHIRKPDQIIQPYEFGEDASKKTCLWLKNLQKLEYTRHIQPKIIEYKGKMVKRWGNQTPSGSNIHGPSKNRWQKRSITFQGIAEAMADQWG